MRPSVAIIGGGVTGLSLSYFLAKRDPSLQITLFERELKCGGKVGTLQSEGCLVEIGADSVLLKNGSPLERLLEELGLGDQIISPRERHFAIQRAGVLHDVPLVLLQGFPKNFYGLWRCTLFSTWGKIVATVRGGIDLCLSKLGVDLLSDGRDISIAEALRTRYGYEVSRYLFETVFGGIHSGRAEELSLSALYPDMVGKRRTAGGKYHGARFISLREGMRALPEALLQALKKMPQLSLSFADVIALQKNEGKGWNLTFRNIECEELTKRFDAVVIAAPAYEAARIVASLDKELEQRLKSIPHTSSAVATFIGEERFLRQKLPGSGYLLSSAEAGQVTGCTFSSNKWDGRAPEGKFVLRVFFGRNGGVKEFSDEELLQEAERELHDKIGFQGTPLYRTLTRWNHGLPQYECGHGQKLKQIEQGLKNHPHLYLTGTSYRGIGIPDCVRQGEETAEMVFQALIDLPVNEDAERSEYGQAVCT